MDNNNIPQNGNERMPESAIPPLPEYEEGSLQSKKADIMEQVSREISGEPAAPQATYAHKADVVRNAFYMDDIISIDEDEPKKEETPENPPAPEKPK